ncbi:MAG: hypothetical protein JST66_07940 [Bacteroidetes bacterium]|nr:hypothetical protein [Bacteroidota bacterium]
MDRTRILIIATATFLVLGGGCKKEDPPRIDLGYGYFPTDTGRWIEYRVDSAWLDQPNGLGDTITYALREAITGDFTDPEGRAAQYLRRSVFDTVTDTWSVKDIWWQTRTATQAERTEENERRIKLIFPPRTGQYWNTNATNVGPMYELTYQEVDVPWSINGMSFDSTVLVKTTYPSNLIVRRTYYERYAKHVGLVYRQVDSSNTQIAGTRGTFYTQTITGYGR